MDVPDLVTGELDGESVLASVDLGGGDGVFVTPGRTLVYRSDGLLSDESVSAFPHEFERLTLDTGRRRARLRFAYFDGEDEFAVGTDHAQDVLEAVLAGHLRATGALAGGEGVRGVYRFQELTLVVGTGRVLKHVGGAAWSEDHEAYAYADLTGLDFEEGDHAMQVVLTVDGRPERIKLPSDRAPEVRRTLERAVFGFHDVESLEALNERIGPEEEPEPDDPEVYTDTVDPLIDDGAHAADEGAASDDAGADRESGMPGEWTPADDEGSGASGRARDAGADVDARLDDIEAELARQTELIERQQELIEQLVDELRRGR